MYSKETSSVSNDTLHLSEVYDPLTDLYNRPLFTQVANSLLRISIRQKMPVSIAIISLDNFSELGEKFGIAAVTALIKESADLLKSISRDSDVLSHFDDDQFALLLYNCNYQSSHIVAERIQKNIRGNLFIQDQQITVSIGLAEFDGRGNGGDISAQLIADGLKALN